MSATFLKADEAWIKSSLRQGKITKGEEAIILSAFDDQTDYDIAEIKKKALEEKLLKRTCLLKLLTFRIEHTLTYLLLGADRASDLKELTDLYRSYYKGKIKIEDFKLELQSRFKSARVEG